MTFLQFLPVPCRKVYQKNAHHWSKRTTLASILGLKDTWNQQCLHHLPPKHARSILSRKLKSSKRNAGKFGSLIGLVFRYYNIFSIGTFWWAEFLSRSYRKQWRKKVLINCFNRRGRIIRSLILHPHNRSEWKPMSSSFCSKYLCSYRCVRLIHDEFRIDEV